MDSNSNIHELDSLLLMAIYKFTERHSVGLFEVLSDYGLFKSDPSLTDDILTCFRLSVKGNALWTSKHDPKELYAVSRTLSRFSNIISCQYLDSQSLMFKVDCTPQAFSKSTIQRFVNCPVVSAPNLTVSEALGSHSIPLISSWTLPSFSSLVLPSIQRVQEPYKAHSLLCLLRDLAVFARDDLLSEALSLEWVVTSLEAAEDTLPIASHLGIPHLIHQYAPLAPSNATFDEVHDHAVDRVRQLFALSPRAFAKAAALTAAHAGDEVLLSHILNRAGCLRPSPFSPPALVSLLKSPCLASTAQAVTCLQLILDKQSVSPTDLLAALVAASRIDVLEALVPPPATPRKLPPNLVTILKGCSGAESGEGLKYWLNGGAEKWIKDPQALKKSAGDRLMQEFATGDEHVDVDDRLLSVVESMSTSTAVLVQSFEAQTLPTLPACCLEVWIESIISAVSHASSISSSSSISRSSLLLTYTTHPLGLYLLPNPGAISAWPTVTPAVLNVWRDLVVGPRVHPVFDADLCRPVCDMETYDCGRVFDMTKSLNTATSREATEVIDWFLMSGYIPRPYFLPGGVSEAVSGQFHLGLFILNFSYHVPFLRWWAATGLDIRISFKDYQILARGGYGGDKVSVCPELLEVVGGEFPGLRRVVGRQLVCDAAPPELHDVEFARWDGDGDRPELPEGYLTADLLPPAKRRVMSEGSIVEREEEALDEDGWVVCRRRYKVQRLKEVKDGAVFDVFMRKIFPVWYNAIVIPGLEMEQAKKA